MNCNPTKTEKSIIGKKTWPKNQQKWQIAHSTTYGTMTYNSSQMKTAIWININIKPDPTHQGKAIS